MAREPFKNSVLGILILGVISSFIANQLGCINIRSLLRLHEVRQTTANSTPIPTPVNISSKGLSVIAAVHDYNLTRDNLTYAKSASLESLFDKAQDVSIKLMADPERNGQPYLTQLKPAEIDSLKQQLPGIEFFSNENMGTLARIDSRDFVNFAQNHGRPADIEFFSNWAQTYPDGTIMPRYIRQQTDYSGCTDYKEMIDFFFLWSKYHADYPQSYATAVAGQLDGLRDMIARDTCACEDKESVENALQRFVTRFPEDAVDIKATRKLHAIEEGTSNMRFSCLSG